MFVDKTKTLSITSGKGGVGKSTLVSNISYYLSSVGKRVLIFDGDLGMANIDIMFGQRAPHNMMDVLNGERDLKDVLFEVSPNIWLIPGGSGVRDYNHLNSFQRRALMDSVSSLHYQFDYMIIDTAPGLAENVLYLNSAVQTPVVVVTPDPSSITDSYALIKVLHQDYKCQKFSIICNQVKDEKEGRELFVRFSDVVYKFLNINLEFIGGIPHDPQLSQFTQKQRLIMRQDSQSASAIAMKSICAKLETSFKSNETKGGLQFFWDQLVGVA